MTEGRGSGGCVRVAAKNLTDEQDDSFINRELVVS
jgi:hypothetical protein